MAKITRTFPSLIGGVSQQNPSIRNSDQAEAQENAVSSVTEGLKKRTPTEWINTLSGWPTVSTGEVQTHFIDRDSSERYVVVVGDQSQNGDSTLKVYDYADGSLNNIKDSAGNPATSSDFTYLDCTDPSKDIKLLTIEDYTFILNKTITPVLKSTTSTARREEALFVVTAGNYAVTYTLQIKGTGFDRTVTFKTNSAKTAGNEEWITPEYIATNIEATLTAAAGAVNNSTDGATLTGSGTALVAADWDITRVSSTIHIRRSDAWVAANPTVSPAFEVIATDSLNSTNTRAIVNTVQTFLELPTTAPNDYVVKIDGDPESSAGDYYVKFVTENGNTFEDGIWQETLTGGLEYIIDETTMPHLLVRLSNGDFLYTPADGATYTAGGVDAVSVPGWTDREVGDDNSNPAPSFIGQAINDIFYFKDRLGLLASDSTILSSAGDYFTFWRTTVVDLLDDERIDVQSSHTRVTVLNNAIPLGEQLVLFSDRTQFSLRGETILTPKSVNITPISEHESYKHTKPISVGSSIYMPSDRGDYSVIRQLVDVSQNRPKFEIVDIMAYIPSYILGNVLALEASKTEDMIVSLGDGDTSSLYVYNMFFNGGQRIQSAWSKFTFGGNIIHVSFVDNSMVLVIKRGTEFDLEVMDIQPFATDSGSEYKTLLDRRLTETQLTSAVYTGATDTTLLTLPYTAPVTNTMVVVKTDGTKLTQTASTTTTITVKGDHSASNLYIGEQYDMLYEFSPITVKTTGINKGLQAIRAGRFWLSFGHIEYEDSIYFEIETTLKNQTPSSNIFSGYTVGAAGSLIGSVSPQRGVYDFGLLAPAQDMTLKLKSSSHLPCRFVSAELEGKLRVRGTRL